MLDRHTLERPPVVPFSCCPRSGAAPGAKSKLGVLVWSSGILSYIARGCGKRPLRDPPATSTSSEQKLVWIGLSVTCI